MNFIYQFDSQLSAADRARIEEAIDHAYLRGEILSCGCPSIDVWAYPTRPPDFQASLSCHCDAMRPLYSSTPDSD
jgi:hypothetical protein